MGFVLSNTACLSFLPILARLSGATKRWFRQRGEPFSRPDNRSIISRKTYALSRPRLLQSFKNFCRWKADFLFPVRSPNAGLSHVSATPMTTSQWRLTILQSIVIGKEMPSRDRCFIIRFNQGYRYRSSKTFEHRFLSGTIVLGVN